jgi:hypothetical protein
MHERNQAIPIVADPEEGFLERMRRLDRERQAAGPQWLRRARAGALYGVDADGHAIVKDLTGRGAA